jgi:hypothetical protein
MVSWAQIVAYSEAFFGGGAVATDRATAKAIKGSCHVYAGANGPPMSGTPQEAAYVFVFNSDKDWQKSDTQPLR